MHLKSRSNLTSRDSRAGFTFLLAGVFLSIAALIFMIINLENADNLVQLWLPIMSAGVVLVFLSLILKYAGRAKGRGRKPAPWPHRFPERHFSKR